MRRIGIFCITLLCLFSIACSDDSAGGNHSNEDVISDVGGTDTKEGDAKDVEDPAHVDAVEEDVDAVEADASDVLDTEDAVEEDPADAVEDTADAVEEDAVDAVEDIADAVEGEDAADAVEEDAADVSPEDPFEGRPPGQCTTSSECPGEMTVCHVSFPGGSCATCVNDSDCPSGRTCNIYRACVTECSSNEECPLGLRCLSSGQCAALPCSSDSDCPALYACADVLNQCERIDCSADATVCPGGTTCSGGRCMEDRQL